MMLDDDPLTLRFVTKTVTEPWPKPWPDL